MANDNRKGRIIIWGIVVFLVLFLLVFAVYIVRAGDRAVVMTFGMPSENVMAEGIHFKIPIVQTIKKYEVKVQKIKTDADSASLDLQDVQTTIALNFHLNPIYVNKLHQEIGKNYRERIIDPAIQESVKAATARFSAEDLIKRRPEVRRTMQELLTEKLAKYYIIVDDFNIENFQFSEEFDKAIEEKVTAEQKKLKAVNDLERIKVEAQQVIVQADAESYALLKKAEAINKNKDIVELKRIEVLEKQLIVQHEFVARWDGKMPYVLGPANPFINFDSFTEIISEDTTEE